MRSYCYIWKARPKPSWLIMWHQEPSSSKQYTRTPFQSHPNALYKAGFASPWPAPAPCVNIYHKFVSLAHQPYHDRTNSPHYPFAASSSRAPSQPFVVHPHMLAPTAHRGGARWNTQPIGSCRRDSGRTLSTQWRKRRYWRWRAVARRGLCPVVRRGGRRGFRCRGGS